MPEASPLAKVLVADDEEGVRRLLASGLRAFGYEVETAADGQTALDVVRAGGVDVLVLDLNMTPVNGWEVVEALRGVSPGVVTIILSAHVDVPAAVAAVRAGVFDVLQKPVRLAELRTRIDAGLSSRGQRRPESTSAESATFPASRRIPPSKSAASSARFGPRRLLGHSPGVARVRDQIVGIARFSQVSTLIIGETGTGKEVVAEAIHELTAPDEPFVSINCAAIPEQLFESELFGHEAGSFTGARASKPGLFEVAGSGTLFLDEVGEMGLAMQPKLLRVLQNRTFRRVGGSRDLELRARIVSATNRKLTAESQDGMRSDLYFRLAGFTIVLPPLRHRREDIDLLANQFLADFSNQYPGVPTRIDDDAAAFMGGYTWPGNVRELKRVVEQAAVLCSGGVLGRDAVLRALNERGASIHDAEPSSLELPISSPSSEVSEWTPPHAFDPNAISLGLNEIQQRLIVDAFEAHGRNLTRAARALRIPRTTLRDRLKRYGHL